MLGARLFHYIDSRLKMLSCIVVKNDRALVVWQARRDRNAGLLDQPGLDPVSRRLAETRVAECDRIPAHSTMERMVAMARKSSKTPTLTPHEPRLRNTDRKLRDAWERLVKGMPAHSDLQSDPIA